MYKIHSEIQKAFKEKAPMVALESTIIAHGMPYPKNVETAIACENVVRDNGAIPVTIAIIKGEIIVGLSIDEIEYIGKQGLKVYKTSRRDLPYVIQNKLDGALTVAATMMIAKEVGIKFFATGGIGGVHRGYETTLDLSQDLEELAVTNVAVVAAGAKSILDLPRTLEYLETKSVPVIGYKTDIFPEFFTNDGTLPVNYRYDSDNDIVDFIIEKDRLGYQTGVLIANPIPEQFSISKALIDEAIREAITKAESLKITGKNVTPFLLEKINEITKGKSLEANRRLVYNNAELAARLAVAYWKRGKTK